MTDEKWLIDANALMDLARNHIDGTVDCNDIARFPIVDAAPVVHGRWIWKDGKCFCSACSKQGEPKQVYQDGTVDEYSYCPNCGAKMDLE